MKIYYILQCIVEFQEPANNSLDQKYETIQLHQYLCFFNKFMLQDPTSRKQYKVQTLDQVSKLWCGFHNVPCGVPITIQSHLRQQIWDNETP